MLNLSDMWEVMIELFLCWWPWNISELEPQNWQEELGFSSQFFCPVLLWCMILDMFLLWFLPEDELNEIEIMVFLNIL